MYMSHREIIRILWHTVLTVIYLSRIMLDICFIIEYHNNMLNDKCCRTPIHPGHFKSNSWNFVVWKFDILVGGLFIILKMHWIITWYCLSQPPPLWPAQGDNHIKIGQALCWSIIGQEGWFSCETVHSDQFRNIISRLEHPQTHL